MARPFIGFLGVLAALFPDRMVALFESVAVDNPDECSTRSWLESGIRTEGVVIVAASLLGGRAYGWLLNLTGAFGAVLLLFPRVYRDLATVLVYDRPDDVEWNDAFTRGVRVIGVAYLLLSIQAFVKRRGED
ncbi:hypothetical protein [Natronobacterium texcoconense]|uniref:DoxX protein n=1 Tax=Natronobacterium texcoconense TaxID=1095778 RepID=A0A1H1HWA2_NATTX|nr:hypothetical protein [Natronobacterium texcoconense]SDR29428.1 hypothetical protein SAMN04489842_3083 [Natronobacterium texcoconense]